MLNLYTQNRHIIIISFLFLLLLPFGSLKQSSNGVSITTTFDPSAADCKDIADARHQCTFATTVDDCQNDGGFVNYVKALYCSFPGVVPLGIILMVIWWLFLFIGLAVTADDFFCPSLTVMAKVLHMSDNIAGVTLLAFGNGAPDIFSAIAAVGSIKDNDAGLAFGALLGAGVFVTAVVSGAVIIAKPFHCMERPLLRDIIFYLAAIFYTFYMMYQRQIRTVEAIGFLLLYVVYVLVVVIGRYVRQKLMVTDPVQIQTVQEENTESYVAKVDADPDMTTTYSKHLADEIEHDEDGHTFHHHGHHHRSSSNSESIPLIELHTSGHKTSLYAFLDAINPICMAEWKERSWFGKIYLAFKAPIQFLLTITTPVVDYDAEKNNWNRHLACLQILISPPLAIIIADEYKVTLANGYFPLWTLFLIVSAILAALAFYFSENETPPKWQPALAFLGFVVSVIWIYSIANEVVNLLQMFGVVFRISGAILGLTFLAWGNSIGDLIADTALARKGYPRIGISACFGGPLFNLLLGVGIPFTIGCIKKGGVFKLDFDFQQIVLTGFLTLSLLSTLLVSLVTRFNMKIWFGIYLIVLYVIFLLVAILTETNVINVTV